MRALANYKVVSGKTITSAECLLTKGLFFNNLYISLSYSS